MWLLDKFDLISKAIAQAEHKYMSIHPLNKARIMTLPVVQNRK